MAILKNLIVNGSSRFLNTAYFQDVSIAGSATLASLSLSGTLSVTGATTLSGTLGVTGAATFGNITATGTVVFSKTQDLSGTANSSPALIVGGTATSAHMELDANEIHAKATGTTVADLYLNNQGGKVYLSGYSVYASGSTFIAPTAAINNATISGDLTVNGVLHSNEFIKNIVKAVGGQLYVSPTFQATSSTTISCTSADTSYVYLTLQDNGITSSEYAGATWYSGSKIMLSGTLTANTTGHTEEILFSSAPGELTAQMNGGTNGAKKLQIKVEHDNASTYFKAGNLTFSDVAVMMYQLKNGSNYFPIGIYIKAYGTDNQKSYIDIFGGSDTTPNARLGLLTGLGSMPSGSTIQGWGIYTDNGFFKGIIEANGGLIGNWTIGTTGMYYNSDTPSSTSITMIPGGTAASTTSIGGSSGSKQWIFTGKNLFGIDTTGKLYASSAEISGKITATSGQIGGWTIGTSSLYSGTHSAYNSNVDGIFMDSTYLAGGKQAMWYLKNDGSAKIGALTLSSAGVLAVPAANITGTLSADHIDTSSITIGQSQVDGLSTALGNKADSSTVTTLSNKVASVYGTSSTSADKQAKAVVCSNFELFSGALITVTFSVANTYASGAVQLNVNSKGAKNVCVANAVTSSANQLLWGAGAVITFRYDGTQFIVVGEPRNWYGASTTAAATAAKTDTSSATGCVVCKGTIVSLSMTNDNTAASPTLNIASTGAKNLYAGNGTTRPLTSNGLGWTAGSTAQFIFDGQYWRVGDTAGLARAYSAQSTANTANTNATNAAKTATNFITADGTNGIKIHKTSNTTDYSQITTDYVQIISDGTHIYKGSNDVACFGDTARIGRIANGIVRTQIDSDSFDVIKRSSDTDTTLATFGETAVIGNMSARGVSIDTNGFKFNNNGEQNFFIGVDNRQAETITSGNATVTNNSTNKPIDGLTYYRVASIPSGGTAVSVVGTFESAVENGEEVVFAAEESNVLHWTVDSGYLWVEDGYSSYSQFEETIKYSYTTQANSNLPYMVFGINAYDENNIPGVNSFAQGYKNKALGSFSTALGSSTVASGVESFACGMSTRASGEASFACGIGTIAFGQSSFACGSNATASGIHSSAFGSDTYASGKDSTAFGCRNRASGECSSAFGLNTRASALYSSAFGIGSIASGTGSTASGTYNTASEWAAVAFGNHTTASGHYSSTFGYYTTASGTSSTAFGSNATASGAYSSAFGYYTTASSMYTSAFGYYTKATEQHQFVIGVYNKEDTTDLSKSHDDGYYGHYAFIIGNGEGDQTRSNAFTVDWSGNVWAAGKVMAENTSHVGMIIMSTTLDTMAKVISVYGGTTWIQHSGYFLYGASSGVTANHAAADGGEYTHTLTEAEMPSHGHSVFSYYERTAGQWDGLIYQSMYNSYNFHGYGNANFIGNTGGGQAHNNMPPYKQVYIWERTA